MPFAPRDLRLLVLPIVARSSLHEHDRAYSGIYQAKIPNSLPDDQVYASIIDSFHRTRALRRPDDFIYQIWDNENQVTPPKESSGSQLISLLHLSQGIL